MADFTKEILWLFANDYEIISFGNNPPNNLLDQQFPIVTRVQKAAYAKKNERKDAMPVKERRDNIMGVITTTATFLVLKQIARCFGNIYRTREKWT